MDEIYFKDIPPILILNYMKIIDTHIFCIYEANFDVYLT